MHLDVNVYVCMYVSLPRCMCVHMHACNMKVFIAHTCVYIDVSEHIKLHYTQLYVTFADLQCDYVYLNHGEFKSI